MTEDADGAAGHENFLISICCFAIILTMMEATVRQWLEQAQYDLGTSRALFKARKYLYAAFMCQQAVEKAIKAILANREKEIPLTHNLRKLAAVAGIEHELGADRLDFLERLTPFAIKARYGSYKKRLSEICDRKTAQDYLHKTEGLIKWLRKKI
ncbi:MAG: HEPN domain-containing protein [Pseudomonadota bacterium]